MGNGFGAFGGRGNGDIIKGILRWGQRAIPNRGIGHLILETLRHHTGVKGKWMTIKPSEVAVTAEVVEGRRDGHRKLGNFSGQAFFEEDPRVHLGKLHRRACTHSLYPNPLSGVKPQRERWTKHPGLLGVHGPKAIVDVEAVDTTLE